MTADHPTSETGGELPEQPPPVSRETPLRAEPAPVSRETPPPTAEAEELFGPALRSAHAYAALLCEQATVRGLIGPREVARVWERHLVNSAAVGELIVPGATVCDLGSGAGLPGIPLAIHRPDLFVTLVEPLLRRTTFLEEAVERLGLAHVRVVRARAEDLHDSAASGGRFDVVTSRAVAPLDRLVRWSLPLVRPGGVMLAIKGRSAGEELAKARTALRRLDVGVAEVLQVGSRWTDPPVTVVRITRIS